jgi:transcriptional regulator with XRE-family HTH domain
MPIPDFGQANSLSSNNVFELLYTRLRAERAKLHLSQREFAEKAGVPLRTYKRFELGECDSLDVFIRISQAFGRAPGFETLFPPAQLDVKPRGLEAAVESLLRTAELRKEAVKLP